MGTRLRVGLVGCEEFALQRIRVDLDVGEDAARAQLLAKVKELFCPTSQARTARLSFFHHGDTVQELSILEKDDALHVALDDVVEVEAVSEDVVEAVVTEGNAFEEGARVCVTGLQTRSDLNGQEATVGAYDAAKARYSVRFASGDSAWVRAANLLPEGEEEVYEVLVDTEKEDGNNVWIADGTTVPGLSDACLDHLERVQRAYADATAFGTQYTREHSGGFHVYVDLHHPKSHVRVRSALAHNRFTTQREASQMALDYLRTPFAEGRRWKVSKYTHPRQRGVKRERDAA